MIFKPEASCGSDACQFSNLLDVSDRSECTGRLCKKVERLVFIVADRRECLVHIIARTRAIHDGCLPNQQSYDRAG